MALYYLDLYKHGIARAAGLCYSLYVFTLRGSLYYVIIKMKKTRFLFEKVIVIYRI